MGICWEMEDNHGQRVSERGPKSCPWARTDQSGWRTRTTAVREKPLSSKEETIKTEIWIKSRRR